MPQPEHRFDRAHQSRPRSRILQTKNADGSYLVPVPQTILSSGANAGLGFSSYSQPSTYHENQFMVNGDYLATPRNTVAARAYFTTIDQYRTFGSPSGYPGQRPWFPARARPRPSNAHDSVVSLGVTSGITANLVNEARVGFTGTTQAASGVDVPSATSLGMTPADRFFDQPPETTVLGPLGSFRLFGTLGNDFAIRNHYLLATDNLSWVHGRHRIRTGAFFLSQSNWRDDLGAARGKLVFQTFDDFLLGLSAAGNQSPYGRSNIQSIQANEGVGPKGEVQYDYRSFSGAAFFQDDLKLTSRLTLNLGLRWEYLGPATDARGTIGNAWPSLFLDAPVPPLSGTLAGNTVAANYDPKLVNPYTGQPFGPPPAGRSGPHHQQLLPKRRAPRYVRAALRFLVAAAGRLVAAFRCAAATAGSTRRPPTAEMPAAPPCSPRRPSPRASRIPTPATTSRACSSPSRPPPWDTFRVRPRRSSPTAWPARITRSLCSSSGT